MVYVYQIYLIHIYSKYLVINLYLYYKLKIESICHIHVYVYRVEVKYPNIYESKRRNM